MNTQEGLLKVCFGDQQLCELKAVLTTSSRITSVLGSVEVRYNVGGLDQRKLDTRLIVPPINPATSGATNPPTPPPGSLSALWCNKGWTSVSQILTKTEHCKL